MHKLLLTTAACLGISTVGAFAQVNQSAQTNGTSTATSIVETGGSDGGSSGGTGYEDRHGNNVDAVAPTIYSNNVCALSVAGSASFLGVGFGAGFNSVDKHCDDRATEIIMLTASQHLNSPVLAQWAINLMCKDNASTAPAGVCGSAAAPLPVAMVATKPQEYPAAMAAPVSPAQPVLAAPVAAKPDWCGTWSKGDGALPGACR